MADVFISYSRADREKVAPIAQALERLGVSVWFDAHLNAGEAFSEEINREIHACRVQVACWSPDAVVSQWVLGEADIGRQRGVLRPVTIRPAVPPVPFNMTHAEDLTDFNGQAAHGGWEKFLTLLGAQLGRPGLKTLWRLFDEGDAAAWKAWAHANVGDPFIERAWERYETLHMDGERNRVAAERAAAREAAERAEAQRRADEARAAAERERLAKMRDQSVAEAEAARRAAEYLPVETPSKSLPRLAGFGAIAVLVAAIAGLAVFAFTRRESSDAPKIEPPSTAPTRSMSPAFAEALQLRGRWSLNDAGCSPGVVLDVVSDDAGERLIWNGDESSAERIVSFEAGALRTEAEPGAGFEYSLQANGWTRVHWAGEGALDSTASTMTACSRH